MTPTIAQYIGDHYTVINHKETGDVLGSGFDATVWRENTTGKLTVSMQGTTGLQDFLSDADLAVTANARAQIVDMVNWWFKITMPAGQSARQIALLPVYDSSTPPLQLGTRYAAAPDVAGSGLVSASDLVSGTEVTGHSLGGYLASAFTRLFASQAHVTHTSTFNSAGFAPGSEAIFAELQNLIGASYGLGRYPNGAEQSNYFGVNGLNVTTNSFYFNQQGQRVELFQEDGLGSILGAPDPFTNHYMYKQTDLLALGAALQKLDPSFTVAKLNELVKAGSNDMKGSYEGVLDGLRRILIDKNTGPVPAGDESGSTPSRVTYHQILKQLTDSPAFAALIGKATLTLASTSLATTAKTDFASFLSLNALSQVVISTSNATVIAKLKQANETLAQQWEADSQLTTEQHAQGQASFSDVHLLDRQAMLLGLASQNILDKNYDIPLPGKVNANYTYTDFVSSQVIKFKGTAVNASAYESQQVMFGNDLDNGLAGSDAEAAGMGDRLYGGAGNDYINAKAGDDYLEGNAGADTLNGGEGQDTLLGGADDDKLDGGQDSDLLKGGTGTDTYTLRASDSGTDTIVDSDGLGSIKVIASDNSETTLGTGTINKLAGANNQWQSQDKRFTYTTSQEGDGSATLLRTYPSRTGKLQIYGAFSAFLSQSLRMRKGEISWA